MISYYAGGDVMTLYEKSIQGIKDYDTKLTRKEWGRIAVSFGFLSSTSLCFASGLCWYQLIDQVRSKSKI